MRLLIIGGSDAGISAALRARECGATAITVVLEDVFPNFSICGLPFYLSGETPDWRTLAHRTEFEGITLLKDHTAQAINPSRKSVEVANRNGASRTLFYDRLLIATGAAPVKPPLSGLGLPGVYPLHTMEDSFQVHEALTRDKPRSAIIIGSGYIGVEMADALTRRGLEVTIVGRSGTAFPSVDPLLGKVVEEELSRHGVTVRSGISVQAIEKAGSRLLVTGSPGLRKEADLVLYAVGVRPRSELAHAIGIPTGERGAICVDRSMRTTVPDIYAAGDCVETWHRLLGRYTYLPLGTTAHKQGGVAGENMAGGNREFQGSVGTQVVKCFEIAIARTGLRDDDARRAGFDAVTTQTTVWDHKAYYPGAKELHFRVTGDKNSRQLLGAQLVGHYQAEVAKRIDIFAVTLFHKMRVEELNDFDLSYTPPVSSPWDPVQMAAQAWSREIASATAPETRNV